jgi:hypothetical protein
MSIHYLRQCLVALLMLGLFVQSAFAESPCRNWSKVNNSCLVSNTRQGLIKFAYDRKSDYQWYVKP